MLQMKKIIRVLAAVCGIVLVSTAAWPAAAKEPRVGVIDVLRMTDSAPRMMQYADELEAFGAALNAEMGIRDQYTLLNQDEIRELIALRAKPKLTAAESARVKALTDMDRARDDELRMLQQTKTLTEPQKARVKELQDIENKSREVGDEVYRDSAGKLRVREQELRIKANTDIRTAAAAVAKLKKLDFVFARNTVQPDGKIVDMLLLGGMDITSDIVARLDRTSK